MLTQSRATTTDQIRAIAERVEFDALKNSSGLQNTPRDLRAVEKIVGGAANDFNVSADAASAVALLQTDTTKNQNIPSKIVYHDIFTKKS